MKTETLRRLIPCGIYPIFNENVIQIFFLITPVIDNICKFDSMGQFGTLLYWGLQTLSKDFQINPLSTKLTKWPNTLKELNCLSVFGHFVGLALKGLSYSKQKNV